MTATSRVSLRTLLVAAAVSLASANPAVAATFRVQATTEGTCANSDFDKTSSGVLSEQAACANGLGSLTGSANATFGAVGVRANAETGQAVSLPLVLRTAADFADTVTFTSSSPGQTTTNVALNVFLDGLLSFKGQASAGVEGYGQFGSTQFLFTLTDGSRTSLNNLFFVGGTLNNAGGQTNAFLRSATIEVALNTPIDLVFRLQARSFSVGAENFAHAEFGNTFGIPLGSNAFELPAGVTANSGDWLVDNRRVGVVPEPASWAMLLAGLGMVGAAMRRRHRTSKA